MRRVTRTDANQRAIVEALKTFGASVQHIRSGEDEGVPDLLVGYRGFNYLLEVKTPTGVLSRGQSNWIASWRGTAPKVVRSIDEALAAIGAGRAR